MWSFKDAFVAWARENLGDPRLDYRPRSYIGVRYGRRVWAPLWPRKDGAYVYLPDPDGSRDQPSLAFESFETRLQAEGLSASWTTKYNAGANPIAVRLVLNDLQRAGVQDLLRASHTAFAPGAQRWSERAQPLESGAAGEPIAINPGLDERRWVVAGRTLADGHVATIERAARRLAGEIGGRSSGELTEAS